MNVSPIPTTRIDKDHPKDQIIGDFNSAIQTRRMTKISDEHAMRAIGTKWVFRNKKDERGIVVRNKERLVAQGYTQEEGIDYDEVFAHVARIEAIRLFLAYASFMGFIVYQMNVKRAFLYGTIEEEVYVCQPLSFEVKLLEPEFMILSTEKTCKHYPMELTRHDPDEEADSVDVHLYRSMIGSLMYLTPSRPDIMFAVCACARFQVTPKMSHLHDVKRIFRYLKGQPKLGLWYLRDSPFDLEAFSDSDYAEASLDRKSTIGAEYVVAANCCGQTEENTEFHQIVDFLSTFRSIMLSLIVSGSDLLFNDEDGIACLTNDEIILKTSAVDGKVTLLFDSMLVQNQSPDGEGSAIPPEPQPTPSTSQPNVSEPQTELLQTETPPTISHEPQTEAHIKQILPSSSTYQRKQRKTQNLRRAKKGMDTGGNPRHQDTTLRGIDAQTRPETASKMSRKVDPSDNDLEWGGSSKTGMESEKTKSMFQDSDFDVLDDDMEDVEGETVHTATTGVSAVSAPVTTAGVAISTAEPRTPPTTAATAFIDEDLTIARTVEKMKEEKDKEKGVAIKDVEVYPRPIISITTLQPLLTIDPKDKGKGVLVKEEPEKPKKVKRRCRSQLNRSLTP
ncbi:ribonuclease H-like domain-containing protein [Tanacetum coccineum]|uniref:Ribonuclease H-like domain-containing protein n=1 Tax=Tanacetum coccineum TaxID=301880 RepID=A0ABQ5IIV0_9ASTR